MEKKRAEKLIYFTRSEIKNMEITIKTKRDERNQEQEYYISDTSTEAITIIMFALINVAKQKTSYEQFLETVTRIWGCLNENE